MEPFDLVLTPNWQWHDHGNASGAPMIWLDGLDIPTIVPTGGHPACSCSTIGSARPKPSSCCSPSPIGRRRKNSAYIGSFVHDHRLVHAAAIAVGCGRRFRHRVPRSAHLLRRPQLRRTCPRDGQGPRARSAVLLHQMGRNARARRVGYSLSAGDIEFPFRGRTRRRDRPRRARHLPRSGARSSVGLCGRARHDAPGPSTRRLRERSPLGYRQERRGVVADRPAASG